MSWMVVDDEEEVVDDEEEVVGGLYQAELFWGDLSFSPEVVRRRRELEVAIGVLREAVLPCCREGWEVRVEEAVLAAAPFAEVLALTCALGDDGRADFDARLAAGSMQFERAVLALREAEYAAWAAAMREVA